MNAPKIRWEHIDPKDEGLCGPMYWRGFAGTWKIFFIHQSTTRGKDHDLSCDLPGIKKDLRENMTEDKLKEEAQTIFDRWFRKLIGEEN